MQMKELGVWLLLRMNCTAMVKELLEGRTETNGILFKIFVINHKNNTERHCIFYQLISTSSAVSFKSIYVLSLYMLLCIV